MALLLCAGVLALGLSMRTMPTTMPTAARGSLISMKKAATATRPAATKGFGARPAKAAKKRAPVVPLEPSIAEALAMLEEGECDLRNYLNPAHFDDPATMSEISRKLRAGEVVVLKEAFRPEFAEMVYSELSAKTVEWELNEAYFPDGYAHRHHNVYDKSSWSARLNATLEMFAAPASQRFVSELTGRDCSGETVGAPSWYKDGDHSLPHTDWVGQRTVSYVWHLSKSWKPEWGGALYWARNDHAVATYPASFNTLVLFSVTTTSAHFVTTVSPHHKGKRLTFNGWWQSEWVPRLDDAVPIEEALSDPTRRQGITHSQLQVLTDLLKDPWVNMPSERRVVLESLCAEIRAEFFPNGARAGLAG